MTGGPGVVDARAQVREAGGDELVERLDHLDRVRAQSPSPVPPPAAPDRGAHVDADVLFAGGGLSLLHAIGLARRGLSVTVADRARVGVGHREWNASRAELEALVTAGIVTTTELDDDLIVARYDRGVCRWHRGGEHVVRGVLDCAVDAEALLGRARRAAVEAGVTVLDGTSVAGLAPGPRSVAATLVEGTATRRFVARVVVDARGAASPYATADLVCPTVGGTLEGLAEGDAIDEMSPDVGEILATTDDVEDGRQHVWEAFPGRPGATTVYLFHYAWAGRQGTLLDLFARFFARRPGYKRGDARLVRPTFGFIPGWSRLAPAPRAPSPRIVLTGDAAARHSPLTFCGFGATLRSLAGGAERIERAIEGGAEAEVLAKDAPIHGLTGALAAMLASPPRDPARRGDLNDLLDTAFGTLAGMGEAPFAALLRDEMGGADFVTFLTRTASLRPRVYLDVARSLGPRAALRWAASLAALRAREVLEEPALRAADPRR